MEHLTHHQFETLVQNGQDPYDEELRKFLLDLEIEESSEVTDKKSPYEQSYLDLCSRYADNAKQADQLETVIFSDIHSYDFKAMNIRIKAQVDFIDLYFEIAKTSTRHDIKKFLTEKTGITHYISEYETGFIIRLHDMNSLNVLQRRISYLRHFECKIDSLKIMEIELAIDFYNFKHRALTTALLKSIRLPSTVENLRVYKSQLGIFTPIPSTPHSMFRKLESGYNIGINHRDADEYWHLYVKTTDCNKQPLPKNEWRIRAEKNIKRNILNKMDNRLTNIKRVLLDGFKGLSFTELKKDAPLNQQGSYRNCVKLFGAEQKMYYDKNRHKRKLAQYIRKNSALNQLISQAVNNLVRQFK
ncbi:hypothetical protein [Acinetobacter baumannii]|uniref:hypothetical protein n=1 Tax=Acinetobacter baumannii TaxID=470 RepID=UPI0015D43C2A|nr:hypothetical protein [Acinetobacter baumannii]MBI1410828.1 hypothetical protein [Acinetobacter baumannii]MBI1430279.1 hypothetical protein [Acinetobacter baumannii]QLI39070.1 hypothetical protein HLG77_04750 [Acinetobacter baumannii]